MSRKVILYLSNSGKEVKLSAPDNNVYTGNVSSEAPLKYLFAAYKDISDVLCIVSDESEKIYDEFSSNTKPSNEVNYYKFNESKGFKTILPQILFCFKEGDELLLETTGGMRNAIMYLNQISHLLQYIGVKTTAMVYADIRSGKIINMDETIRLFKLLDAMQELQSNGNAHSLKLYCEENEVSKEVRELINSMCGLFDDMLLCRTGAFSEKFTQFEEKYLAANAIKEDAVIQILLPVLYATLGEKPNVIAMIRWCVKNRLLQQAITFYREQVPKFLFDQGYIQWDKKAAAPLDPQNNVQETAQLLNGFLEGLVTANDTKKDIKEELKHILELRSKGVIPECSSDRVKAALQKIEVLRKAAYDRNSRKLKNFQPCDSGFDAQWFPKEESRFYEVFSTFICPKMLKALSLTETTLIEDGKKIHSPKYGRYQDSIKKYIAGNEKKAGYSVNVKDKCALEKVIRDYLYIHEARNLINHAGEESNADQKEAYSILFSSDPERYASFDMMSATNISTFLAIALEEFDKL